MRMQMTPGLWRWVHSRHVAMRENCQDSRRPFGLIGIDRHRPAVCYRAANDDALSRAGDLNVCCVVQTTSNLERTLNP